MRLATVILAAGQGKRMKSELPKVMHPIGGKPMVLRAVEIAAALSDQPPVVVVSPNAEPVRKLLQDRVRFAVQDPPLGTAHAVLQARELLLNDADMIAVFYADMPLLRTESVRALIASQTSNTGAMTLLTVVQDDPRGFGRIVRGQDGNVREIVEEKECTPEQLAIHELNVGVYAFNAKWLWENLPTLSKHPTGEYYVTDMLGLAVSQNLTVIGSKIEDADEVIGVNTRVHLADAEAALRRRLNQQWMLKGVTMIDPATTYIGEDVTIGQDTVIQPNTHLQGQTSIGANCVIGPNSVIRDSKVGDGCVINSSVIEESTLESDVSVGPFGHLRPKAYLEKGVHMGNFGEVKNSRLGAGTRMGHFSYIGDSQVGADVNIGGGTITANYDGVNKHRTTIGDHAFIGSDSMLIAPLNIAANARTAAGSVVTKDVPEGYIAIGVPARMRPITRPTPPTATHATPAPTDSTQPTDGQSTVDQPEASKDK